MVYYLISDSTPKIASLKHSQLGLDFFEEAYLDACPYQFAKVALDI